MKLEVGMYCYNKTNRKLGIGEIISFPINNYVNIKYKNDIETISIGNIEASHNIIDLIEVGDYVNGAKVNFVYRPDGKQVFRIELDVVGLKGHMICGNENIKSIVTKEQIEDMTYKVV